MDVSTERIAVLRFTRIELARQLAAGELSDEVKQAMRAWLTGEMAEGISPLDGVIDVKALGAGNGRGGALAVEQPQSHAKPSLLVRKQMRKMKRKSWRVACEVCGDKFKPAGLKRHKTSRHAAIAASEG